MPLVKKFNGFMGAADIYLRPRGREVFLLKELNLDWLHQRSRLRIRTAEDTWQGRELLGFLDSTITSSGRNPGPLQGRRAPSTMVKSVQVK